MGNIQRTGTTGGIKQPALSLDQHVEDPDRTFSFFSYLQFRTDATLLGFHTVYLAFLVLLFPELTAYIMRAGLPGLEIFGLLALFLCGAFLATILFQVAVFVSRTLDALVSYVDEFWRPAVPGVIVFLILGQPVLQISQYYFDPGNVWIQILLGLGLLLLSAGISAAALFVFPVLRGINSTLLLVASVGGRAIMFPFEFRDAYTGAPDFLVFIASVIVCTFFLFIALQQRYRLQLSPYYERYIVSKKLMWIGVGFTLAGLIIYLWLESLRADPFSYQNGDLVVRPAFTGRYFVPGSLVFYCMAYWLIASVMLNLVNTDRFPKFLTRRRLYNGFAAAFVACCLAVLYLAFFFDSRPYRARIVQYGDLSAELLSLPGVLLDADDDSNSAWPGGDPDDRDPCLRSDFHDRCLFSRLKRSRAANPAAGAEAEAAGPDGDTSSARPGDPRRLPLRNANFETAPERPSSLRTGSVSRTILLTFAGTPGPAAFDLNDFFKTYSETVRKERPPRPRVKKTKRKAKKGKGKRSKTTKRKTQPRGTSVYESRFLLAVNRIPEAMPALARSLDGVELRTGVRRRALFSELSEAGYRTICGGHVAGAPDNAYLDREHAMDLDSGCQVYITPDELPRQDQRFPGKDDPAPRLLPVARAMHKALRKYSEKRTVIWIHFDGRNLATAPGGNEAVARAEFTETLELLRKSGNLMVVPLGGGEKITVPVWIFARSYVRKPPQFDTFRHLVLTAAGARGVTPPPPGFEDDFTGILTTPWISATWASALFYRLNISYPLITYKRKAGTVQIFDGITGARWELPERKEVLRENP